MSWSYDQIAGVYASDMGASMPFDDVGFYRRACAQRGGAVLELGCGTGRILLPLLDARIDATGVDRSLPMLQQLRSDAASRGIAAPRVAQMDLLALALRGRFATILMPYSLATYVTDAADLARLLRELHARLVSGGALVLDAFIPRPVATFTEFRRDYRRAHGGGYLEREKRITAHADGTNEIERRYRILRADDSLMHEFTTRERIRPYTSEALGEAARSAGFFVESVVHDYGERREGAAPQFATLLCRAGRA